MVDFNLQLTPHFKLGEFACKCGGINPECLRAFVLAGLPASLERLRKIHYPDGLIVISGYRCATYNKQVGGASKSQHLYGAGADIHGVVSFTIVQALKVFSGIGIQRSTKKVVHVDVRHLGSHNTIGTNGRTNASPSNPAIWYY